MRNILYILILLPLIASGQWNKCYPECTIDSSLVYYYHYDQGVVEQIWSEAESVTHGDVRDIFNGSPDLDSFGTPSHINSPTISSTVSTWINDTQNDPNNGNDQFRYIGYFFAEVNGTVLSDNNTNSGERYRIWLGECCAAPSIVYESPLGEDSPFTGGAANSIGDFYTVDRGWHLLIVEGTDISAFAGFNLRLNGVNYAGQTSKIKPYLRCKKVPCGYVLTANEFECVPENDCQPKAGLVSNADLDCQEVQSCIDAAYINNLVVHPDNPQPSTVLGDLESDNNESEGSWSRSANIGTSTLYARSDHQHPIVRIPNPGDPVLTYTGNGTMDLVQFLDRESTEEWYAWKVRARIRNIPAGLSWEIIRVPSIAGFQQPMITGSKHGFMTSHKSKSVVPGPS